MGWISLVALAGSQRLSKDTSSPSPTANGIGIASLSSYREWLKEIYPLLQYGTTLPRSAEPSSLLSILSMEASPARIFLSQDAEQVWKASAAAYSSRSFGSSASYDPDSSSWRTFQRSLFEEQSESLESFVAYGMTVDGVFYPLRMWGRITDESGGGFWRTPDANMERGTRTTENLQSRLDRGMPLNLNDQLNGIRKGIIKEPQRFPTPVASARSGRNNRTGKGEGLGWVVKRYPTPQARDWKDGLDPQPHGRHAESLPVVINLSDGGALNPTWVEWLMGYPSEWTVCAPWAIVWFRPKRAKPSKG